MHGNLCLPGDNLFTHIHWTGPSPVPWTHTFTPRQFNAGNLSVSMFLGGWRKPENPNKTHTDIERM